MAFPTSYAVTEPDDVVEAPVPAVASTNIGNDANTVALRQTYEALQAARGSEKYGLKSMTPQEVCIYLQCRNVCFPNSVADHYFL
jgi:hypothetical protein